MVYSHSIKWANWTGWETSVLKIEFSHAFFCSVLWLPVNEINIEFHLFLHTFNWHSAWRRTTKTIRKKRALTGANGWNKIRFSLAWCWSWTGEQISITWWSHIRFLCKPLVFNCTHSDRNMHRHRHRLTHTHTYKVLHKRRAEKRRGRRWQWEMNC